MEFTISDVMAKLKEGSLQGLDCKLTSYIETHIKDSDKVKKDEMLNENEFQAFLDEIDEDRNGKISEAELDKFLGKNKEGQEIKESIKKVLAESEIPLEEEKVSQLEGKPGVKKEEDDDRYYVNVQKTGSEALEGNQKTNNCLWNIWTNYFKGSADWATFQESVMKSNPQIYGDDVKRGSRTGTVVERWIYDGEKIYLPADLLGKVDKPQEKPEAEEHIEIYTETGYGNEIIEVTKREDGSSTRVYKDEYGNKIRTESMDAQGRQIEQTDFDHNGETLNGNIKTDYNDDGSRKITINRFDEYGNVLWVIVREIDAEGVIQSEKVDDECTIQDGQPIFEDGALTDEQRQQISEDLGKAYRNMSKLISSMNEIKNKLATASSPHEFEELLGQAGDIISAASGLWGTAQVDMSNWEKPCNSPEFNSYRSAMDSCLSQYGMRLLEMDNLKKVIEANQSQDWN